MIDSMIEPKPGEGRGINTINEEGPGLQKEERDASAALPGRDPDFKCLEEKDQVGTRTTEALERDCGLDTKAEVTSFTFAEACAQPSAKHLEFHGSDGPVRVVEVDGTFFIQNDEAEAKAARSKALELASEAAVAPKAAANPAAAEEEVAAASPAAAEEGSAAAPTPMPEPAAAHRISYAAAAKSAVGPKPSAAGFEPRAVAAPKFSAGLKRSTPASQPAVVAAPLKVVDDFAVAQSTPLPECITGVEGDKEGEFCARSEKFNVTVPIPKIFHHMSFEAEEVAKELAKKIKAEEDAKEMAKKSAASKRAAVAPTKKKKTHQKPATDTKTTEQTTAPAPAKEDAPAMHRSTSFRALVLFGVVALVTALYQSMQPSAFTLTSGLTSFSNGAAAVATKTVNGWSNALDEPQRFDIDTPNEDQCGLFDVVAPSEDQCGRFDIDVPNEDQCGLFDVVAPKEDQCGLFDAPKNNERAPNESPEAFELTDPVHVKPGSTARAAPPHLLPLLMANNNDPTTVVLSTDAVNKLIPLFKNQVVPQLVKHINKDPNLQGKLNKKARAGVEPKCMFGRCVCPGAGAEVTAGLSHFGIDAAGLDVAMRAVDYPGERIIHIRADINGLRGSVGSAYATGTGCALFGLSCNIGVGASVDIGPIQADFRIALGPGNKIVFRVSHVELGSIRVHITPKYGLDLCGPIGALAGVFASAFTEIAQEFSGLLFPVLSNAINDAIQTLTVFSPLIPIPPVPVPPVPPFDVGHGKLSIELSINTLDVDQAGNVHASAEWPIVSNLTTPAWRAGRSFLAPRDLFVHPYKTPMLAPKGLVTAWVDQVIGDSFIASLWYLVWPSVVSEEDPVAEFYCNLCYSRVPNDECPFAPHLIPVARTDPAGFGLAVIFKDINPLNLKYRNGWKIAVFIPPVRSSFASDPIPLGSITGESSVAVHITADEKLLASFTSPISTSINVPTFDASNGKIGDFKLDSVEIGHFTAEFAEGVDHVEFLSDAVTEFINKFAIDWVNKLTDKFIPMVNSAIKLALDQIKLRIPPIEHAPFPTTDLQFNLANAKAFAVGSAGDNVGHLSGFSDLDISITERQTLSSDVLKSEL